MPPHDDNITTAYDVGDTITYDGTAATAAATTAATTATYTIHNTDNITTNTFNEMYNGTWTGRTLTFPEWTTTINPEPIRAEDVDVVPRIRYEIDLKLEEFQRKLDRYLDRIFQILREEYNLGISEEEFMKLIKEE